jgi:hypothetical protein
MRRRSIIGIVAAGAVLLSSALTGCSKTTSSSDSLDQQKKDVMGAPAPASAQAEIARMQARQQQQMQQAPQAAQPPK